MCTVTAERDVWDAYIKVSNIYFIKDSCLYDTPQNLSPGKAKMVKKFRKKPFLLYDAVRDLIDSTRATGEGVFRAGQTSAFERPNYPRRDATPSDFAIDPVLLEDTSHIGEKISEDETDARVPVSISQLNKMALTAIDDRRIVLRLRSPVHPFTGRTSTLLARTMQIPQPHNY
jgi:hypothetical protein